MATMKSHKINLLLSLAIALVLSTFCYRSRFVAAASQKKVRNKWETQAARLDRHQGDLTIVGLLDA